MVNRFAHCLTEPEAFDAIVIGTGQSGLPLTLRLADAGRKTAILERKPVVRRAALHRRRRGDPSILDSMYAGASYTVIQRAMPIHLTGPDLIPTLLGELKPLV